jgi:hypothetical protein
MAVPVLYDPIQNRANGRLKYPPLGGVDAQIDVAEIRDDVSR